MGACTGGNLGPGAFPPAPAERGTRGGRGNGRGLLRAWAGLLLSASPVLGQAPPRELPVEEMARGAHVIGVASVRTIQPRKDPDTGLIFTDIALAFSEVWKGAPPDPLVLVKAGGELGGQASLVLGRDYTLGVGEAVVLFATRSTQDAYAAIGLRQGLYRVGPGPDPVLFRVSQYPRGRGERSDLRLESLRNEVARVLGRPEGAAATGRAGPAPEAPAGRADPALPAPSYARQAAPPGRSPGAPASDPRTPWLAGIGVGLGAIGILAYSLRRLPGKAA